MTRSKKRKGFSFPLSSKRRRTGSAPPKRMVAAAARKGKYGQKKRITRKGWQMARKQVAKKLRNKRTEKHIKAAVQHIIDKDEETHRISYDRVETDSGGAGGTYNSLTFASGDAREGLWAGHWSTQQTQSSSSTTWDPTHFVYPLIAVGDGGNARTADEVKLMWASNKHVVRVSWPDIESAGDHLDLDEVHDELYLVELLFKKHSAADIDADRTYAAAALQNHFRQWAVRKHGNPIADASFAATAWNSWATGNVCGTASLNWQVPRVARSELATGVVDRMKISAPIARQRVRRFTRRGMQTGAVERAVVNTQAYDNSLQTATRNSQTATTILPATRFNVRCGFAIAHKGEKIRYKDTSAITPRHGYEYVQLWCYRNVFKSAPLAANSPTIDFVKGQIRLQWKE